MNLSCRIASIAHYGGSAFGIARQWGTLMRRYQRGNFDEPPGFTPRFCAFSEGLIGRFKAILAFQDSFPGNAVFKLLKLVLF